MFKSIFLKTLYERRWSTIIWAVSIFASVLLIVLLFPTFKESFGEALKDVPESFKKLLGSAEDYQTLAGYIDLQVVVQMVFLTIIQAVILGTSLLAGEESSGTLQSLLVQPVSRFKIYRQKFFAMTTILLIASVGLFLGEIIGAAIIQETVDVGRLAASTLMIWLITVLFGTLAYAVGALSGKRGAAGVIAGFYAFAAYMVTSLTETATVLKKVDYASPFHYLNSPSVMKHGLDIGNLSVMVVATVVLFAIGAYFFVKRDVYQR
jgi:ABC-2 type transport system permease protein